MLRIAMVVGCVACAPHASPVIPGTGANGLVAMTKTRITGTASFPAQRIDEPVLTGKVADLSSEAEGDHTRWSLSVEDDADQRHGYQIVLPGDVALSISTGTTVSVETAIGRIEIVDGASAIVLAIGKLPASWQVDAGSAVRIHAPGGTFELVASPWRAFELAGVHYVGAATAADDFAIVRLP